VSENNNKSMTLNLMIWRQACGAAKGKIEQYKLSGVYTHMSFFEMLDYLNQTLAEKGIKPVVYDNDCREGICGTCGLVVNGVPHGPGDHTTTCLIQMRQFKDGDTIFIEPFRAKAFPVLQDLVVDRSAMDEIIQAGGFIDVSVGGVPDGNDILIGKEVADLSMDAAACLGCGACVATCKNASSMLFVSAKISQLALLPQGKVEAEQRVQKMIHKMDELGFGNCTNEAECEVTCPEGINISNIARMNREFLKAIVTTKA